MDHKWTTNGPHFICGPSQRIKKLSSILTSTRFTLIDQIKRKAFFTVLFFREKSIELKEVLKSQTWRRRRLLEVACRPNQ